MAPRPRPAAERFWPKVEKTETCWLWRGALSSTGYGNFYAGKDAVPEHVHAHRWAYEDEHGPVQDGLQLDHLCRVRACVRPAHLESVTAAVNLKRGDRSHLGRWQRARTHCPQGHPYDAENTYVTFDGRRLCRACNRERQRARRLAWRNAPRAVLLV